MATYVLQTPLGPEYDQLQHNVSFHFFYFSLFFLVLGGEAAVEGDMTRCVVLDEKLQNCRGDGRDAGHDGRS